ncbi:MAG TPA: ElyC/SanA/YdcF family protein [Bacteroidia bacterium]|nr:ElyC/SanA/YdcF family protein [Bacteroidia bacterium]
MGAFRLIILLILFFIVAFVLWRLQKYKIPELITRWVLLPLFALLIGSSLISNKIINKAAENKVYSDVNLIPYQETALVLGADQKSAPEFFFKRIDAAFILYKAGKVKNFIVSGCVGPANYDEAANMKFALVAKGVPDSLIIMDKEGDHTLNSILRCREVYHKNKITVVSQSYHASRAVYLASKNGIDAIGFYSGTVGVITPPKEYLSRIKAVLFH